MVKIDWRTFFYDRVIIGWHYYPVYEANFDLANPDLVDVRKTAKKVWLIKWRWKWGTAQPIPWHRCFMRNGIIK